MLDTPSGFEITLMRLAGGELKIGSHFGGEAVSLSNSQYRLSRQGAQLLSQKLAELYG